MNDDGGHMNDDGGHLAEEVDPQKLNQCGG